MMETMYPHLGNLALVTEGRTRVATAENVRGDKGGGGRAVPGGPSQEEVLAFGQTDNPEVGVPARDLGGGWKVRPCISLESGAETPLLLAQGPGVVRHIWITVGLAKWQDLVLRAYWDDEAISSVEVPLASFFCAGMATKPPLIASLPINVNPTAGANCYFPMPFAAAARITVQNRGPSRIDGFFYAITWEECPVAPAEGRFHASFRQSRPLAAGSDHVILDGVRGKGHYVGTHLSWQQNSSGWWGEGEMKFFIDDDRDFPSICGTGTEDYFGGAWCFKGNYSSPFLGYPQGECDDRPGNRHLLYRFHVQDPIRFREDLRVTVQALGWRSERRFLPLHDDISSVAYWYQAEPHAAFPVLPSRDEIELV
jgi:hypothetical protein